MLATYGLHIAENRASNLSNMQAVYPKCLDGRTLDCVREICIRLCKACVLAHRDNSIWMIYCLSADMPPGKATFWHIEYPHVAWQLLQQYVKL